MSEALVPLPEGEMPTIPIQTSEGIILLNPLNSLIRLFGNEMLNHVELVREPPKTTGFQMPKPVMEFMFEAGWSVRKDRYVNQTDLQWWIDMEMSTVDAEIEEF